MFCHSFVNHDRRWNELKCWEKESLSEKRSKDEDGKLLGVGAQKQNEESQGVIINQLKWPVFFSHISLIKNEKTFVAINTDTNFISTRH